MIEINKELLDSLFEQAKGSPRLRMNYDLRSSKEDNSQRMLNALLPGTVVPIHRHPMSNECVVLLKGRLDEVIYDVDGRVLERMALDPSAGMFGCVVPMGAWHTVEVMEPSVILEVKDGRFGADGSGSLEEFLAKGDTECPGDPSGDLKERITYLIGMERQSGAMEVISPLYVARMLNVPLEEVEAVMREWE